MTNPTPRDQRTELFEIEEQDDRSPFVLIDANGQRVEAETPREQRLFLFEVFEQDNPSPYAMVDREEWFACQATKQKERRLARFHALANQCRNSEHDIVLNTDDQAAIIAADDALLIIEQARVKAGQTKSDARRRASAANGKLGGRPKQKKE